MRLLIYLLVQVSDLDQPLIEIAIIGYQFFDSVIWVVAATHRLTSILQGGFLLLLERSGIIFQRKCLFSKVFDEKEGRLATLISWVQEILPNLMFVFSQRLER